MPSTHLSLHYHVVFSTKERRASIAGDWRPRLHDYLGGIVRAMGGKPHGIGGTADHVHILAGLRAADSLASMVRKIKASSSGWIHQAIGSRYFAWQDGYGAFTVCRSEVETVAEYIRAQEKHHRGRSFQEEYLELLRNCGIEFDERFLW